MRQLESHLGIHAGETTADGLFVKISASPEFQSEDIVVRSVPAGADGSRA